MSCRWGSKGNARRDFSCAYWCGSFHAPCLILKNGDTTSHAHHDSPAFDLYKPVAANRPTLLCWSSQLLQLCAASGWVRYFTLLVDLVVCVLGFVYTVLTGELGDTILSIKKKVKTITNVEVDTYSHKSDSHTYPYTHHTSTTSAPWMCKLPLSLSQSSHLIIDFPPYLCNCLYLMLPPHNLFCCLRQTHRTLSMLNSNWSTNVDAYTHVPDGYSKVDTGRGKHGLWREQGVHSIVRAVFFLSDSRFSLLVPSSLLLSGWLSFICVRSASHSIMIVRALFLVRFSLLKSSS